MVHMSEQILYCAKQPLQLSMINHRAMIQTLNRLLGYDEYGYPIYFPADVYEAALGTVNDAKIIFSSGIHPDYELYEVDPEKSVREVGGHFAGYLTDAEVDYTGHPMAYATLVMDPDPSVEQLIKEGKLSVSPSLGLTRDENGNIIKIKFQNLLIFPETHNGPAVPGDPGTKILNSKPNPARAEIQTQTQFTGKTMTETIEKPVIDPDMRAQLKELTQQFSQFQSESRKSTEKLKEETDNLKLQLTAKNEELTAKNKELEAKEDALKQEKEAFAQFTAKLEAEKAAAREREFKGLLHDPIFPEGLLKAENAEETLKAEFDASPVQFTRHVLSIAVAQNQALEGKDEQGQQFTAPKSDSKWDSDEGKLLLAKFGVKRDQMGV